MNGYAGWGMENGGDSREGEAADLVFLLLEKNEDRLGGLLLRRLERGFPIY